MSYKAEKYHNEMLVNDFRRMSQALQKMSEDKDKLEKLLTDAVEALEFYADEKNWDECPLGNPYSSYVIQSQDVGDLARKRLERIKKEMGNEQSR